MIGLLTAGNGRYDRILKLLDRERSVILQGPLTALQPVVDKREAALAELLAEEREPPEDFLTALRAKAERNARLLHASLAGLRAAGDQIDALRAAGASLRTYTAQGASRDVAAPPATRDERA